MTRNALLQPFASTSIWNQPIGPGAVRVRANLLKPKVTLGNDQTIVCMDPTAPLTKVLQNAGFASNRCKGTALLATVPMATGFVVPSAAHNYSTAAIHADGHLYMDGDSFGRCAVGGNATVGHAQTEDLYGDGLVGAKGGTRMSSLGGCIRLGEFAAGAIPHALALDIDSLDNSDNAYVWPATKKDSYSYRGHNRYARPGCLYTLPLGFPIAILKTTPGRIVATALWSFGGYNTNDAKGSRFSICCELGPAGSVAEEFAHLYGYNFATPSDPAWMADIATIFAALEVVTNNGPRSIGGA